MTGVSTLGQALTRISLLEDQNALLNSLSVQLATGKRTQEFSGLGTDILTSKRSRVNIGAIDTYTNNITNADRRMQQMSLEIQEFQAQAKNLWDLMIGFGQESLHDADADIIYSSQSVNGNQALNGFANIPALAAASAPELDPPNDRFDITFSDPDDPQNAVTVTVDISEAAAAAGPGNAQVELVNYINAQLAAAVPPPPAELNAQAVALGTGEISLQGTSVITISNNANIGSAISNAGLAALGLSAEQFGLGPEHEIGINSGTLDVEFATLQEAASDLYDLMLVLLNVEDDSRFLFGGADTVTQPVTDTGALDARITNLLTDWQTGGLTNDQLISGYRARTFSDDPNAITDTTIGYSAALSAGNAGEVFVRVKEDSEIEYTVLANEQAFRDILVATSFIKNGDFSPIADVYAEPYTPGDVPIENGAPGANLQEQKDNFYAVFNNLTNMINNGIDEADKVRFGLESDRARIDSVRRSYIEEKALFQKTIDNVENVDINQVAVELQTIQTQLQASYTITARVSELTLVNFI